MAYGTTATTLWYEGYHGVVFLLPNGGIGKISRRYRIKETGWKSFGFAWLDTGNHDALLDAADFVAAFQKRQGLYISCIEEIAYKKGFISKEQLLKLAQPLLKTNYGKYLVEVAEGL